MRRNTKQNFKTIMKRTIFKWTLASLMIGFFGQQESIAQTKESPYNYKEVCNPIFYSDGASPYRSASGKPGDQYWQNAASYDIKVSLNDQTHEVKGTVKISYTNNSPDELAFIWLQI